MAGIYHGHLLEFPQIRVDCFTTPRAGTTWTLPHPCSFSRPSSSKITLDTHMERYPAPVARLYLLTHVHSDHLTGLSSSFTGKIVCTPDTKRMLLRLEAENERELSHHGVRERRQLKYAGLKRRLVASAKDRRVVDMIETIEYNSSKQFELGYENGEPYSVTITALDANHCPGSAMFLIQSRDKAVLHTGDVRADADMIKSLRSNSAVADFIQPSPTFHLGNSHAMRPRVPDRIYLDTGAVLGTGDMPERAPVLRELVEQMAMYPKDTIFFLNTWCFGWEHVVKAVASHFGSQVHVDDYKRSIYTAIESDPSLLASTTPDAAITRFHACERRFKCSACRTFDRSGKRMFNLDKLIVHVNMVEIKTASWDVQQRHFREKLSKAGQGQGAWPFNIDCPIARHSPLPELQNLVEVFRPHSVSPNCVIPQLQGLDYFLLPSFCRDLLQPGGYESMVAERDAWFHSSDCTIRLGPEVLVNLKKHQDLGVNLLEAIAGGGNSNDDYLPDQDRLPLGVPLTPSTVALDSLLRHGPIGSKRKDTFADQMYRAAGLLPPELLEGLSPQIEGIIAKMAMSRSQEDLTSDLSDTDQEEVVRKRRRRLKPARQRFRLAPALLAKVKEGSDTADRYYQLGRVKIEEEEQKPMVLPIRQSAAHEVKPIKGLSKSALRLSRFHVDKAHLAALCRVGEDPPEDF